MQTPDVVVVGAGIVGVAIAFELAREGRRVLLLERGDAPGREASAAAAGIVGAEIESHGALDLQDLALASRLRYPAFVEAVRAASGTDPELVRSGVLLASTDAAHLADARGRAERNAARGLPSRAVSADEARALVPGLSSAVLGGAHFAGDGRVDPVRLFDATLSAFRAAGGALRTAARVTRVQPEPSGAWVVLEGDELVAKHVVLAAGAWSSSIAGVDLPPIEPVRGQIVELRAEPGLFGPVVFGKRCYLVPREDGRVLVGSTMERVGFDKRVTAGAVRELLDAALELVPALAEAAVERTWAGLRPMSPTMRPVLGTLAPGLHVAAGHGRNGVLLAPITAAALVACVRGEPMPREALPFAPERL
jgi:glycine oxidase